MARPVTLFTGQWADLPLDDLAAKASEWGFDGLELACWGDHFEVDQALAEAATSRRSSEVARAQRPELLRARRAPRRAGGLRPDRRAAPGDPPARGLGRRRPGRRPAARGGADEGHRARGRAPRRHAGERLHRLAGLAHALLVPAERLRRDRARLRGLRRAVGADPGRVRRRGRPLRARGAPDRDRLRLRDHAEDARRDRTGARLSGSTSTRQPLRPPAARLGALRRGVRRPDLPRARQGLEGAHRRPPVDPRLAPQLRRGRARLGLRLARPRRRRLRGALPRAQPDRLRRAAVDRVGGLGNGPRVGRAGCARVREAHAFSPSDVAFDAAMQR